MKSSEFNRLVRNYILHHLPGFRARGSLVHAEPLDYLLRGIQFESSGFDAQSFTVWAFVQPLYEPKRHIAFTFGARLGALGGQAERWWRIDKSNEAAVMTEVLDLVRSQGLPFLDTLRTVRDLAEHGDEVMWASDEAYVHEAIGYAWFLSGNRPQALSVLDEVSGSLARLVERRAWQSEIKDRVVLMHRLISTDPDQARKTLDQWTCETTTALRLR